MGVIPDKLEFKNCSLQRADNFIALLIERKFIKVTHNPVNDTCHFDRYGFAFDGKRVSVVYDTKARMLSVAACEDAMEVVKAAYALSEKGDIKPAQQNSGSGNQKNNKQSLKPQSNNSQLKTQVNVNAAQKPQSNKNSPKPQNNIQSKPQVNNNQKIAAETVNKPVQNPKNNQTKKTQANTNNQDTKKAATKPDTSKPLVKATLKTKEAVKETQIYANNEISAGGLSVKKYTEERFAELLKKVRKNKSYKLKEETIFEKDKPTELRTYTITDDQKIKLKLRFMPQKQIVQLQGKQSKSFSDLRLMLSEQSDYKSVVNAHIEMSQKTTKKTTKISDYEKQLKKRIPYAIPYLSEQSKIDFTIGIMEILSSDAEHLDYSMLLLPPFRGLERLIIDLQRAQNVIVKMIGQAYEKEDGQYVLKQSYRRKIGSVVYAEVIAELYREYYKTRNYYTHSDNTQSNETRMVTSRREVCDIFERLLQIVDYNCKKLSEIGFSI